MLEFNCTCGQYRFSVPDELGGDTIQCPKCGRLNDIPTASELDQFDETGGYKVDLIPDPKALDLDLAIRAFSRQRADDLGQPIDMRATFEDVMRAGAPLATNAFDEPRGVAPKYDPITGELLRPLAVKNDTPRAVISMEPLPDEVPVEAVPIVPTIDYGRRAGLTPVAMGAAYVQLFRPVNLLVMAFVFIFHLLLLVSALVALAGFWFVWPAPALFLAGLISHYGNTVDEIGPSQRDELPVPLRNASVSEDIWLPFFQTALALIICFAPLVPVVLMNSPPAIRLAFAAVALLFGLWIMPAVWLTTTTGGVFANLRPDRLISVIHICGSNYVFPVISLAIGCIAYVASIAALFNGLATLFATPKLAAGVFNLSIGGAALVAAIFFVQAAAWQIGLLYRAHQPDFPWIMQRHVYTHLPQRSRPAPTRAVDKSVNRVR
ncbi:MAG: hypothetical protein JO353_12605 [Phycisphaerae bacterium]|nr:hypothetical protein [Phycisphaerae bacterium]